MATKHEVTRTRTTFDGVTVQFWTDGAVTAGHPANNRLIARGVDADIIAIIEGDVCLYDAAEIKGLVTAGRKAKAKRIPHGWIGHDPLDQRRLTAAFSQIALGPVAPSSVLTVAS